MAGPSLTIDQLATIEQLARRATPGPWSTTKPQQRAAVKIGATLGGIIFASPPGGQFPSSDAEFIAAASPDVVLALVEAAKERDRLEEDCGKVIDERDAFHDRIDTIADALGDETEWSNCNDRGARALELASEIVKERDELRRSMEGSSLGAMRREVAQLRDMLAAAKAEIADIRRALDAHGHDGAFEAAAKQRAEVVQLRATIARLRKHVEKSTIINEDELEEIINAE